MQRRTFLKAAGVAGIVAAGRAPAFAQGTKLHIVRWVDFIPEADVELKRQAPEASKALGAEVTFEFINANDLQPRITAAIQSGSGADIIQMLWNWPQLYANALVDVSDVAEPIGKAQGGYYDVFNASAKVGGKWLAVPHGCGGNAVAYRRSWFNEIGVKEFPKTWDEYREIGKKLKAKGKPIGQALGHSFGDPPVFAYAFLWDFGGAEVDASGKKVAINSKGTIESVKFLQNFWKDACDEGGLAWEDHPMWAKVDKPLQVFRQAARLTRAFGHPGPASAKATEAYTKYVIVDMYAKAVQGTKAEDAVKWAEGELKKIYEG